LLVALLFTIWPLGRASRVRAAALFRDEVAPDRVRPPWGAIAATLAVAALLVGLAVATSESRRIALYFCLALGGIFGVFLALGQAVTWLAGRAPRKGPPEVRLALSSIAATGGLARSVVLSLGSGLSLLVAVALADASIVDELESRLPKNSPDLFILDLPRSEMDSFSAIARREVPGAHINSAPMLRGRIVRLAGRPVEQVKASGEVSWVLSGDRGLSYAETVPEGSKVVAGEWWPAGYAGPALVSFEADIARQLGLKLGDTVTVNVLGRNIEAKIANLREVRWESLAINFVMVFSPNTLSGAPHNLLATVALPKDTPLAREADLARRIGRELPSVSVLRVRDAINSFNAVFGKVMVAVRAAGSITLLAGALVLAGALATAQRRRIKQAVIVKVLGGTRLRILAAHVAEYVLLAAASAVFAILLGSVAAWLALTRIMDVPFVLSWGALLTALATAIAMVLVLGSLGTWRVLAARPVPHLRSE
jgi:putative ABC transport system permease protein